MMHLLLFVGWILWGLSVATFVVHSFTRSLSHARQQVRVAGIPAERMTDSDMRVLLMGDARDPIERHIDAMTSFWRQTAIFVTGGFLAFFTFCT